MATFPSAPISSGAHVPPPRGRRGPNGGRLLRMSGKDVLLMEMQLLDGISRDGTWPIRTVQEFHRVLDDMVLNVAELSDRYHAQGIGTWWHMCDLLDDVVALRSVLRGDLPGLPATAMLVPLPVLAPVYGVRPLSLGTPEQEAIRCEQMRTLEFLSSPDIWTASLFCERVNAVVYRVHELMKDYEQEGRKDWSDMADLLPSALELMDAIRPNVRLGTMPTFAVKDLPYVREKR